MDTSEQHRHVAVARFACRSNVCAYLRLSLSLLTCSSAASGTGGFDSRCGATRLSANAISASVIVGWPAWCASSAATLATRVANSSASLHRVCDGGAVQGRRRCVRSICRGGAPRHSQLTSITSALTMGSGLAGAAQHTHTAISWSEQQQEHGMAAAASSEGGMPVTRRHTRTSSNLIGNLLRWCKFPRIGTHLGIRCTPLCGGGRGTAAGPSCSSVRRHRLATNAAVKHKDARPAQSNLHSESARGSSGPREARRCTAQLSAHDIFFRYSFFHL